MLVKPDLDLTTLGFGAEDRQHAWRQTIAQARTLHDMTHVDGLVLDALQTSVRKQRRDPFIAELFRLCAQRRAEIVASMDAVSPSALGGPPALLIKD